MPHIKVPVSLTTAAWIKPDDIPRALKEPSVRDVLFKNKSIRSVLMDGPKRAVLVTHLSDSARAFFDSLKAEYAEHAVQTELSSYSTEAILKAMLPEDLHANIPSSFTIIGHIAHVNLRDEYLPYKYIIGQAILMTSSHGVETVVNKVGQIHEQFRFFEMELLAGVEKYEVSMVHLGVKLVFDFRRVYFNSRLATEHARLIALIQPGETVVDVMAGVGPFALPLAKKGVHVIANDLNPSGYEALRHNAKLNHLEGAVRALNLDGKDVIKNWKTHVDHSFTHTTHSKIKGRKVQTSQSHTPQKVDHYIMNLPDSAIEFLGAFDEAYGADETSMPMIHVYCFTKNVQSEEKDILERVSTSLGRRVEMDSIKSETTLHLVRNVAPGKNMWCCSFRLTAKSQG